MKHILTISTFLYIPWKNTGFHMLLSNTSAYELGEARPGQGPRQDRDQTAACTSYRGPVGKGHKANWEGKECQHDWFERASNP